MSAPDDGRSTDWRAQAMERWVNRAIKRAPKRAPKGALAKSAAIYAAALRRAASQKPTQDG